MDRATPRERPPADDLLRQLNALEMVRTAHGFSSRLKKGEASRSLDAGFEALDASMHDVLQRLVRAWGFSARRQHTRLKRKGHVSLCAGLGAIHFFASDQKPFEIEPDDSDRTVTLPVPVAEDWKNEEEGSPNAEDIALDQPLPDAGAPARAILPAPTELYRVDRWQIRDLSPRGLLLVGEGGTPVHVRVGELLGIQRADQIGTWSIAVARWLQNPQTASVEMGIEFLAPRATPAAVCRDGRRQECSPTLLLPAVESLKRPATLLVERGLLSSGQDINLIEEGKSQRRVRVIKRIERTNGYEQWVFVDVASE